MECVECEEDGGEKAEVEFMDGTVTTVAICDECREMTTKSRLVFSIEVLED